MVNGVDTRLKGVVRDVCHAIQAGVAALEVMPDHVHLLLDLPPQTTVADAMQKIKGVSSRILRKEFPELKDSLPALWAKGYYSSPIIPEGRLNIVKRYIHNQKYHHRYDYG